HRRSGPRAAHRRTAAHRLTLRAVVATRLGGPEVLELQEVPEPTAGPGQVLIRVTSAGVNFADLSSTRGTYAMAPPPPFIPGLEVAGEEVGSGKPVFAIVPSGGYAELVAAEERFTWDAEGLDLGAAGGYALTGLTAFHALRHVGGLQAWETVLMTAAAGGVGSSAIQVARALGAGRCPPASGGGGPSIRGCPLAPRRPASSCSATAGCARRSE